MRSREYRILPRALDEGGGYWLLLLDEVEVERQTFTADPDTDPHAGMGWFNSLNDAGRALWLAQANSARPVDAYGLYLRRRAYRLAQEAGQAWMIGGNADECQ